MNKVKSVKGNYKIVTSLFDANKQLVTKNETSRSIKSEKDWAVTIPLQVKNPKLWHGKENPYLYNVQVDLYHNNTLIETVTETTGFRTVAVDRDKGFFLNGKPYPLRGTALHQHYPGVGAAMKKEHFDKDQEIINDIGLNSVRLSHYPHSKYRFELCDRDGIVAFTELPWIKQFYGTDAFKNSCYQQMKEMIYQLFNHPSIAIWGMFNEIRYDTFKGADGVAIVKELNRITKEIDPENRLTCTVSWKAGKRNDVADLSGWNRYQGWYWNAYPGGPNDFTWIDKMREDFPNRVLGITEYGAGGAINHFDEHRHVAPYNKDQFHPVDFYNYSQEEHFKELQKRPWLWGTYLWTLFEFLVPDYNQGRATFIHDKGLVAEDRTSKKAAYYLYKANWSKEPVFHLAYKQFRTRLENNTEVTVYSNLKKVSLTVNGQQIGTLENALYGIYKWGNIPLQPGKKHD